MLQQTLGAPMDCVGVGLHSGRPAQVELHPASADNGITFTRSDLPGQEIGQRDGPPLLAGYDAVVDTRLSTVLGSGDVRIGTVEHLLAAFAGLGIDNAHIVLDGPEVPIMDGSANAFVFLIDCAGIVVQSTPRRAIVVRAPIRVAHGDAWAELLPSSAAGRPGFDARVSIDFAAGAIGRQSYALRLTPETFRAELAAARTFTQSGDIAVLRAAGLALGGSLDNAVVVEGDRVLNPGGLRMHNEFARHKLLDAVGDLALLGAPLLGRFVAHRTGHALNNRLLHALRADPSAWCYAEAPPATWRRAA